MNMSGQVNLTFWQALSLENTLFCQGTVRSSSTWPRGRVLN